MENVIKTECESNYIAAEQRRIQKFKEAAGHVFSESMINEMKGLGFFLCPASLDHHGNHIGGLYDHSMQVFRTLEHLTKQLGLSWQRRESPLLVAIFHDWVKLQDYIPVGTDEEIQYIRNNHKLLIGHGEVSILLAQQFLQNHISAPRLTQEEIACIRYHMGAFTDKKEWDYYSNAIKAYPNVLWTHTADMVASQIQGT